MTTYIQDILQEEVDSLSEAIEEYRTEMTAHIRSNEKLQREMARMAQQRQEINDFIQAQAAA